MYIRWCSNDVGGTDVLTVGVGEEDAVDVGVPALVADVRADSVRGRDLLQGSLVLFREVVRARPLLWRVRSH
jgi:hypothetical protein